MAKAKVLPMVKWGQRSYPLWRCRCGQYHSGSFPPLEDDFLKAHGPDGFGAQDIFSVGSWVRVVIPGRADQYGKVMGTGSLINDLLLDMGDGRPAQLCSWIFLRKSTTQREGTTTGAKPC